MPCQGIRAPTTQNNQQHNIEHAKKQVGTTSLILHQDEAIEMQWRQLHLYTIVVHYNHPILKSVQLEIKFKSPTKREKTSTWQKNNPQSSPRKSRMGDTNHTTSPRGERREETKERQPYSPKVT